MKNTDPKQFAGVWLDSQHATIISNNPDNESNEDGFGIQDKVTAQSYHGSKGEHGSNNADQANTQHYFKSVASILLKFDDILIFGPGKSQEQFVNFLNEDVHFQNKKITVEAAQQLTTPQMISKVREFFSAS